MYMYRYSYICSVQVNLVIVYRKAYVLVLYHYLTKDLATEKGRPYGAGSHYLHYHNYSMT